MRGQTKWSRFLALPRAQKYLLLEAFLWLALAQSALRLVPFRYLGPWLGRRRNRPDRQEIRRDQIETAAFVRRAVAGAARHVPWSCVCLPKAMAGAMMLRRRRIPYCLYFGVQKSGGDIFNAHAWLKVGSIIITGGNEINGHIIIGIFK
ncbi:MAG: lasso peptide biosynthesis B2 protein [Gammaproteobacteria bacterium]